MKKNSSVTPDMNMTKLSITVSYLAVMHLNVYQCRAADLIFFIYTCKINHDKHALLSKKLILQY